MKRFLIIIAVLTLAIPAFCNEGYQNELASKFKENKAIIYELNVRTFGADDIDKNGIIETEKNEKSGNFVNAQKRLDEIKDLGFNTILLMPITPVGKIKALGTAGCLYAMNGFSEINPQLDEPDNNLTPFEEAKIFVEQAHKKGLSVIVELPSCGAYDLYLSNPELFVLNDDSMPVICSDWVDVRLFKVKNRDGSLNSELLKSYFSFFEMLKSLNIDGVKASVAYIKPSEFWQQIIKEVKKDNPQFLFLADVRVDSTSFGKEANFTSVKKLLKIGFDGYYGNLTDLKTIKSAKDFHKRLLKEEKLNKKFKDKKATTGNFFTHDEVSMLLKGKGSEEMISQTFWLNSTLKINPQITDGMQTGDKYLYRYANKKASKTYTDDEFYYVHKGKMDIFNFSRRPEGASTYLKQDLINSLNFRNLFEDVILKGSFKLLKTDNKSVFAYEKKLDKQKIIVYFNNSDEKNSVKIKIPKINKYSQVKIVKYIETPNVQKKHINSTLMPYELQIVIVN